MARPQPGTRAAVCIDGWNLHRGCERAFGFGQVHPLLLGQALAGERELDSVHYFIGVPDSRVDPDSARIRTRQLAFMRDTGVIVIPKKLRYRWEWKIDKWSLPHPRKHSGETRSVSATAINQGREKGVDTALVLEAMVLAQRSDIDVVIIVSADSDLTLVADTLNRFPLPESARVENAVVNPHGKKIINRSFAWSHQIDQQMFELVRDDIDYARKLDKADRHQAVTEVRSR